MFKLDNTNGFTQSTCDMMNAAVSKLMASGYDESNACDQVSDSMHRILNQAGQAAVATWVKMHSKKEQNLDAWYADAEQSANDASPGESIIIEMRGMNTISGNPEILTLPDSAFDWEINV